MKLNLCRNFASWKIIFVNISKHNTFKKSIKKDC